LLYLQNLGAGKPTIFEQDLSKKWLDCIEEVPASASESSSATFDTKEDFSNLFEGSFELGVDGWGASVKASASYKKATKGISTSKGVQMKWWRHYFQYDISADCRSGQAPLNPKFQSAWNALPLTCEKQSDCDKYYKLSK
jgi:hypothetical protein